MIFSHFQGEGREASSEESVRTALLRFKKPEASGSTKLTTSEMNDLLKDEIEAFSEYMEDSHNIRFLSLEDFQDDYMEEDPVSEKADISKPRALGKWLKYFKIPNLVQVQTQNENFTISLTPQGKSKRAKRYSAQTHLEKKKKIWKRLARGFRKDSSLKKRKKKGSLIKEALLARGESKLMELGVRLGTHLASSRVDSVSGFSLDVYYTLPLFQLSSFLDRPYLPALHFFATLEDYQAAYESASIESPLFRTSFMLGFLYSVNIWQGHLLKAGVSWGIVYESTKFENSTTGDEFQAESGMAAGVYVLAGYGYNFAHIRVSALWRLLAGPIASESRLGMGFSVGVGIPLRFE